MKITGSVMDVFRVQKDVNDKLKVEVDNLIGGIRREQWHYESRVKKLESFAQKLDTGRVNDPEKLEDFFACTLVVKNTNEIKEAIKAIKSLFKVIEQRPKNLTHTAKHPASFIFDDLRLYLRLKPERNGRSGPIFHCTFECQIKTFLQHAWSQATHDLIYKTSMISWGKQRIAYQVKAMLEHAEMSIAAADTLANQKNLVVSTDEVTKLVRIITLLQQTWEIDTLPPDLNRTAQCIDGLLSSSNVSLDDLNLYLSQLKANDRLPSSISLFDCVVKCLAENCPDKLLKAVGGANPKRILVVPRELRLPDQFNNTRCPKVIFLK